MIQPEIVTSATAPMVYRDMPLSESMFLSGLVGMLPNLLPKVVPFIGNLLGKKTDGGKSVNNGNKGGTGLDQLLKLFSDPNMINQLAGLLGQGTAAPAAAQSAATSLRTGRMSRACQAAGLRSQGSGRAPVFSEAKIAPALLAALPALMPLLKQVLSPQTVQAVINQPNQHMNTIINGIKDFARIGIEADKNEQQHLERLNPGVGKPVDELLQSPDLLSPMSLQAVAREISFKRARSVHMEFAQIESQTLFGKTKVPYLAGRTLQFPIRVQTPRNIPQAMVELVVKDPRDLKILIYKKARTRNIGSGALPATPRLSAEEAAGLEAGRNYLIGVSLIWKKKSGPKMGTSIQQEISLVDTYAFDHIEEASSELIALNDVVRFRPYWHKVFQASFNNGLKHFDLRCKYLTILVPDRSDLVRTESKIKITQRDERKVTGLLKAGMEYSLEALNRLIPMISPGSPLLSKEQLQALRSDDFTERFNQACRYRAKLRGRRHDNAVLWVYPEVKLQTLILQKAQSVDDKGLIRGFGAHRVRFPIPVLQHFIGARTQ